MYVNARASHTIQPVLSQLLEQTQLFTIMHQGKPTFVLLPWSVYRVLRSLLTQHDYGDSQLIEPQMIGISNMRRRFLSFQKLEDVFHTEQGECAIVIVLKRNEAVGALVRYDYYMSLIDFLKERQVSGLEPFLTETPDAPKVQGRLLSLTAFRNLALQLPHHFAQEQHQQGGNLPFIVTCQRQPALVVLSWETWKRLLHLLAATEYSEEDCELMERLIRQIQELGYDAESTSMTIRPLSTVLTELSAVIQTLSNQHDPPIPFDKELAMRDCVLQYGGNKLLVFRAIEVLVLSAHASGLTNEPELQQAPAYSEAVQVLRMSGKPFPADL